MKIVHEGDNSLQLRGNAARRGIPAWNVGLTKETDQRVKKGSEALSIAMKGIGHPVSEEVKKKISARMKLVGGGYRRGSGVGKSGWYDGIWCDSTWELAFVIWCKNHGKVVARNTERFDYEFNGKKHYYLPDFVVDGELVEIKGRRTIDALIETKLKAANGRVKLMLAGEMAPILASVKHHVPLEKLYWKSAREAE